MNFREYNPNDVVKIINLVRSGLNISTFGEAFWQWKFSARNNYLKTYGFVVEDNGEIVAFASFFPYEVKVKKTYALCYLVADVVIDEKFKGKGLFTPFFEWTLQEVEGLDSTFGTYLFSSKVAYPIYTKKFNYSPLGKLKYYVGFGGVSELARRKLGNVIGGITGRMAEVLLSKELKYLDERFEFKEVSYFSEEFDGLWEEVKFRWPIAVKRDNHFLNRRFAGHPLSTYAIFGCYEEKVLKGYIVLKGTNVIDFIYSDEPAGLALFSKARKWFKLNRVPVINVMLLGSKDEFSCLRKAGFFRYDYKVRPFGLYPSPELLLRVSNNFPPSNDLFDSNAWKFTNSDIDCGI